MANFQKTPTLASEAVIAFNSQEHPIAFTAEKLQSFPSRKAASGRSSDYITRRNFLDKRASWRKTKKKRLLVKKLA